MALFRLKHGTYSTGRGASRKVYNHANAEANVVESEQNLAAIMPEKFERIEEHYSDEVASPRQRNKVTPTAAPATKAADPAAAVDLEQRYGSKLEELTVKELQEIAEAEDIEVPKSPPAKKEDVVKALRAGKHPA